MMRVFYITDSIGAPRLTPEECLFNDTWCYRVTMDVRKTKDIEPIYWNLRGLETTMLRSKFPDLIRMYNPDIIILQVGIVDCAPRALKKIELAAITRMGVFGRVLHSFIKKYYSYITKFRNLSYVSQKSYTDNLIQMREASTVPIYAIAISKPSTEYIQKSPLINDRVTAYNEVMSKVFGKDFINPFATYSQDSIKEIYMSDLHHINEKGQGIIADCVLKEVFGL